MYTPPYQRRIVTVLLLLLGIARVHALAGEAPAHVLRDNPSLRAGNLRCEYLRDPLGIDIVRPRLSWIVESSDRGQRQTAYRILVASSRQLLDRDQGDLWDSGRVASNQTAHVEYAGRTLDSGMQCFWKVRAWDRDGRPSAWSVSSRWTMGLMKPEDWKAQWIAGDDCFDRQSWIWSSGDSKVAPAPPRDCYFRLRVNIPNNARPTQARVLMAADSRFALWINGKEVLRSGKERKVESADITNALQNGENVVAVAANYNGNKDGKPGFVGKIIIALTDGRELVFGTDNSWKVSNRPADGWQNAAFDDREWKPAHELNKFVYVGDPDRARIPFDMNQTHWLRKTVRLEKVPQHAFAHVNVKGYFELYVNGQKVGMDVVSPPAVNYAHRSYVLTYDVRPYLKPGENCIGLWLGYGWYHQGCPGVEHSRPLARVQLEMESQDERTTVATDASWKSQPSHHRLLGSWWYCDYGGELIDARRARTDWSMPAIDEKDWTPARVVSVTNARATAPMCPLNRITERFPALTCTDLGNGACQIDFGKCITGWLRLRLPQMQSGQKLRICYAEKRFQTLEGDETPAGHVAVDGPQDRETIDTATGKVCYQSFGQRDQYISAGRPNEQFEERFNFHVFRYAIVQGLPASLTMDAAEAVSIETDMDSKGSFSCSNELFNRIFQLTLWSNRSWSLGGYLAELGRERKGYGPMEYMLDPAILTLDVPAMFTKWAENWLDEQSPKTGEILNTAPMVNPACGGGPAWAASIAPLSWAMYVYYGDRRLLERCYEPAVRYRDFLERNCKDGLLVRRGSFDGDWLFLGDWLPPNHGSDAKKEAAPRWPSPQVNAVFNNCYRVYFWRLLEQAAKALGKANDIRQCGQRIPEISRLVHETYYDRVKHSYLLDQQTYQALPLYAGTVPAADRDDVMKQLEHNILVSRKGHLDTGALGTWFLIHYLQSIGRNDLIYTIANQRTYPGWGYMLDQGATTLWEQWNGYTAQSCNLYCAIGSWFHEGLAGILPDPKTPGYQRIIIKPSIVGDLKWVKAHYDSIHGRIRSDWTRDGRRLTLHVVIPANTTAEVHIPTANVDSLLEGGKTIPMADGVKLVGKESGMAICEVGSGEYQFTCDEPQR